MLGADSEKTGLTNQRKSRRKRGYSAGAAAAYLWWEADVSFLPLHLREERQKQGRGTGLGRAGAGNGGEEGIRADKRCE